MPYPFARTVGHNPLEPRDIQRVYCTTGRAIFEFLERRCLLSAVELSSAASALNGLYPYADQLIASSTNAGLWISDGTSAGTTQLAGVPSITPVGAEFNQDAGNPTAVNSGGRFFF